MEDIKKLYQEAKAYGAIHSKSNSVLRNYMEAVDHIASNSPKEYISNLEYIISSSYGANTFSSFLEKHKVPLSYIPKIKNVIKKLKNKNEDNKLSDTYSDMISVMESYENKYSNCMDMAIYFEDCLDDRYLEAYYTNFPKLSNKNVNISKFLERYGNGCIADMIVYTEANKALLENVYDQMVDKKKKLSNNQWIKDSLKDFSYVDNEILDVFTKESLEYQVNHALENNEQAFRESVMMGMQMVSPFTESDVRNMEDYILYQEYKLCGAKNESERTIIMESINRTKKALEPLMIEEDVADSVIPMLPNARISKPILSKQFASVLAMESSFTESTKYPEQKRSRFNKKPRSGSEVIQYIEDVDNDKFKEWFFKTPAGSKLNKKTFNFKSLVDDEQNIDSVGYVFKNEIVAIATINNARSKTNKVNICAVHPRHKGCLVNLFRLIDSRWISDTTVELNKSTQKEFVDAFQSIGYEITLERGQVVTLSRKKKTKGTAKTESVSFTEALSSNTRNKKTGKAPGYLKNNHDLSYGEDDDTDDSDDVGDDIFGDHIDDTSKEKKTPKTEPEPYQYDDIDDDSPDNAEKDKPASGANYYYYNYNYTNSNNTSSKSHNDYSTHTSHDSHDKKYHTINNTNSNNVTKTVDSHNQKNDNSTNKRVHSHDYGDHHEESVKIYSEKGNMRPDWWGSTLDPVYLPEELTNSLRRMRMEFFETIINIVQTNQKFAPLINDEYFKLLRFFGNYQPDEYEDDNGIIFYGNPGGSIGCMLFIISNNFLRYDYWENIYRIHRVLDENPNFDLDQLLRDLHSAARNAMAEKYNGNEPVTGCTINTKDSMNDLFTAESTDPKHIAHLWNTIGKYASIKAGDTIFIRLNEDGTEFIADDEPIQESVYQEEVGDADDNKPESDNPIRDTMMDIDQKVSEGIGSLKRGAGKVRQTARAVAKPFKRVLNFIDTQIEKWRDSNENDIKEQLADPHQSNSLIKAFKSAVKYGAIYKAGLLLNPIFIFLAAAKHLDSRNNKFRIRNEMIGELKTELQVLEEKIKDADANKDRKAKYQMMRLKNELTKKLIRVGGTGDMKNMI